MIRSQSEIKYCALLFATSDYSDPTKHPKLVITYNVPFQPSISTKGATTICTGSSVVLSALPSGPGITYQWMLNNVTIPGANLAAYNAGAVGNYTCLISNGCTSVISNGINITQAGSLPATPGVITGNAKPCPGDTGVVYLVTAVVNASGYNWTVPSGASITTGQTTNSIKVNFASTFISGTITVTASNVCGTSGVRNKSVSRNIPAAPSAIIGQTYSLCSGAVASYSVNAVNFATNYMWIVPVGVIINSGQGTVSVNLLFPSNFVSGIISVKASNNCGMSAARNLTVRGTPPTPGAIVGPSTVCANQAGVVYSVAAVGGGTSYSWSVPSGASITAGQGSNSITAKFGTTTGIVRVRASNACGVGSYSNLTVIINCREFGLETISNMDVSIYPNPSKTFFTMNFASHENDFYTLTIRDIIGRVVQQWSRIEGNQTFEFGNKLCKGMYIAEVGIGNETKVIRIVKSE